MPPKYGGSTGWATTNHAPVKFTPPSNKFAGYQPMKTGEEERKVGTGAAPVSNTGSTQPSQNKTVVYRNTAPAHSAPAHTGTASPPVQGTVAPAPAKEKGTATPTHAKEKTQPKPGYQTFTNRRHQVIGYRKGFDALADAPIVVTMGDLSETVYLDGLKGSAKDGNIIVKIEGKFNALTINNCERCGVVFEDGVSVCEVVNCKKMQLQVTGLMNNWQIDKSSEITLYISEASLDNLHVLTSQHEAVNVVVPLDDDFKEFGFPEQLKSQYCTSRQQMVHDVFESTPSESM